MQRGALKLVEECSGTGDLLRHGERLQRVRYRISRYQGMLEGSGMPIPGLHRVEGSVDLEGSAETAALVGTALTLKLEDGRSVAVTLADSSGRVIDEGHGPGRGCSCC